VKGAELTKRGNRSHFFLSFLIESFLKKKTKKKQTTSNKKFRHVGIKCRETLIQARTSDHIETERGNST
jgi:hypothetical protein